MRRQDIPKQEHKDWNEIFQFQWFLLDMSELELAAIRKSETPDFLLQFNEQTIGIEHTLYFSDQSLLRFEKDTNRIIEKAQLIFEKDTGLTVNVGIHWNDSHWKSVNRDEKNNLPLAISDFVKENFLPEQNSDYDWHYLHSTGLDRWITYISIRHFKSQKYALWAANGGGAVGAVSIERLKNIISNKEEQYEACRRHCDECWLLIYATGAGMSSVIDFSESVENLDRLEFPSKFGRIFFFDGWYKKTIELKLSKHAE